MSDLYVLDENHNPVRCADLMEWGRRFGMSQRRVAFTGIECLTISTVFLGINHQFFPGAPPLLFETMIFGDGSDEYQERCSTWEEAEAMHERAVAHAKELLARAEVILQGVSP